MKVMVFWILGSLITGKTYKGTEMVRKILMIFFVIFSSSSFAGTIDPNTPDSKYIEYGAKFHSVVPICCDDGIGKSCGSAVIIDPHWIITAAHVLEGSKECSIVLDNKKYTINKVINYPKYEKNIFGHYDLALGFIQEELKLDHYPELYLKNDEVGKVCSIAGYGITGTFNTGIKIGDNKKRAGSNFVEKIERGVLMCTPSRRNHKFTELEFLIGSGDSGGGLFIDGKLAGIHSSVVAEDGKPDSTYTDESCHSRISLYGDWIVQTISAHKDTQ